MKSLATIILLGISLLTALLLESSMTGGYAAQLAMIIVGIILTTGVIFGLWIEAEWSYPLGLIIFAAALANLLWLFKLTNNQLTFVFGILVNVAGLVMCLVSLKEIPEWAQLETYEVKHYEPAPAKKAKKKRRR